MSEETKEKFDFKIVDEAIERLDKSEEKFEDKDIVLKYWISFKKVYLAFSVDFDLLLKRFPVLDIEKLNSSCKNNSYQSLIDEIVKLRTSYPVDSYDELYVVKEQCNQTLSSYKNKLKEYEKKYEIIHNENGLTTAKTKVEGQGNEDEKQKVYNLCCWSDDYKLKIRFLNRVLLFLKRQTLMSVENAFGYLGIEQLESEKKRHKRWYITALAAALIALLTAIFLGGCNYCDITSYKNEAPILIVKPPLVDSSFDEVKTVEIKKKTSKEVVETTTTTTVTDKMEPKSEVDSFDEDKWAPIIMRSIFIFSCLTLMILSLNQASRMRKMLLNISKEINEFRYIEGLLKAKNEVDFDRSSNEAISKVIDEMLKNHLEVQKKLSEGYDQNADADLVSDVLKHNQELMSKIIDSQLSKVEK